MHCFLPQHCPQPSFLFNLFDSFLYCMLFNWIPSFKSEGVSSRSTMITILAKMRMVDEKQEMVEEQQVKIERKKIHLVAIQAL